MTSVLSPLSNLSLPPAAVSGSSASAAGQSGDLGDLTSSFGQILSATLLGGSQSSGSGLSGGDSGSLLLPLMLSLLERLMQMQLENGQNDEPQADTITSSTQPESVSAGGEMIAGDAPSGRPVGGVLTNSFYPGHNGLDFGVPVGTDITATMSGKVVYAGWNNQGYGNLVIVENGPYRTYFAHLSEVPVQLGQIVSAGDVVGLSGNTGNSTGPHLHYEVRRDQVVIDPTSFTL